MAGEETKKWTFHHLGVIVDDMDKAIEYYQSLGIVDFPPPPAKTDRPPAGPVWVEIKTYGETVIKDGQLVNPPEKVTKSGRVVFCKIGSMQLELIQPGDAIRDVNRDFLESNGEGVDHIAYTVKAEDYEEEVEKMKAKGLPIIFSGKQASGGGFSYFDTRKVGGIITELMIG